jgi:hypothetical protein
MLKLDLINVRSYIIGLVFAVFKFYFQIYRKSH